MRKLAQSRRDDKIFTVAAAARRASLNPWLHASACARQAQAKPLNTGDSLAPDQARPQPRPAAALRRKRERPERGTILRGQDHQLHRGRRRWRQLRYLRPHARQPHGQAYAGQAHHRGEAGGRRGRGHLHLRADGAHGPQGWPDHRHDPANQCHQPAHRSKCGRQIRHFEMALARQHGAPAQFRRRLAHRPRPDPGRGDEDRSHHGRHGAQLPDLHGAAGAQ